MQFMYGRISAKANLKHIPISGQILCGAAMATRSFSTMTFKSGRHFLQIPGPTNIPDRVLRAIDQPTVDHRARISPSSRSAFSTA